MPFHDLADLAELGTFHPAVTTKAEQRGTMKPRLILAAIAAILFTSATACAVNPTSTPDEPATSTVPEEATKLTRQIQELQAENAAIREELATMRSEIDQQTEETPPNNDICGRSPGIQEILIRELTLPSCQLINDRELLRLSHLSVSSDGLWPGDLDDLHNLETLRVYLNTNPPEDLLADMQKLQDLTLEFKAEGTCGKIHLNGEHVEISRSGPQCRLAFVHTP